MNSLYSGLVDYWRLWEASGNRASALGKNTLTDNNTVTQNPGIVLNAAQFTNANSESLTLATNSDVETGDIDFTIAAWAYLDNKDTQQGIVSKDDASAQREYGLKYGPTGTDRFQFTVYTPTDVARTVSADALGSPAINTWYFLVGWHDANANNVNIEVNGSFLDSAATTASLQAAQTSAFTIGGFSGSLFLDGRVCEVGFWKRVLTQQERWWLYNNGLGRTYPFIAASHAVMGRRRNRRVGVIP